MARTLSELGLAEKRVLIRTDLNVQLGEGGTIADDAVIREALPTIQFVLKQGGHPIVCTHLGRPHGGKDAALSVQVIAKKFEELLGAQVIVAPDSIGAECEQLSQKLDKGQVLLLENVRFYSEEESGDRAFGSQLSRLGDVFVNDAFSMLHRADASNLHVAGSISERGTGLLVEAQINAVKSKLNPPKKTFCLVVGGVQTSERLEALAQLAPILDKVVVGGTLANTFLAVQGVQMGRSLYDTTLFPRALEVLGMLARKDCKLYLPVDFRVGTSLKGHGLTRAIPAQEIPADSMALDVGPASSMLFSEAMADVETILWSGPMGVVENEDFSHGTIELIQALSAAHGKTIAAGRESTAAVRTLALQHKFELLSPGGTSLLQLVQGKTPQGLAALD